MTLPTGKPKQRLHRMGGMSSPPVEAPSPITRPMPAPDSTPAATAQRNRSPVHVGQRRKLLCRREDEGKQHGGQQGAGGKLPAQNHQPQYKADQVDDAVGDGNGKPEQRLEHQADAGGAAADDAGGLDKQRNAQRKDGIARHHQKDFAGSAQQMAAVRPEGRVSGWQQVQV